MALSGRVWIEPYIIGFLAMLITYIATRRIHSISSDTLALIQAETWQELTGQDPAALAEEVIRLSLARDAMFETGCRNAAYFGRELFGREISRPPAAIDEGDNPIDALWEELFERHVVMEGIV